MDNQPKLIKKQPRACDRCAYVENRGINPETLQPQLFCRWLPRQQSQQIIGQPRPGQPPPLATMAEYTVVTPTDWCYQFKELQPPLDS